MLTTHIKTIKNNLSDINTLLVNLQINNTIKKKIIAFSLWGKLNVCCIGAIKNAILAKKYFKDWICRYYYDETVPLDIINFLNKLSNVELVFIPQKSGAIKFQENGQFGLFWRFYPFNDNDVEIWLARDTDSRLSPYEKHMIDKFIQSNKIIHSFKDNNEPLLRGGMIAFKNFNGLIDNRIINNKKLDFFKLINNIPKENTHFYADEKFLNNVLYPLFKNFYCSNTRNDSTISFPKYCGPYVGAVVDDDDNHYNKFNETVKINNKWTSKKHKNIMLNDYFFHYSKILDISYS